MTPKLWKQDQPQENHGIGMDQTKTPDDFQQNTNMCVPSPVCHILAESKILWRPGSWHLHGQVSLEACHAWRRIDLSGFKQLSHGWLHVTFLNCPFQTCQTNQTRPRDSRDFKQTFETKTWQQLTIWDAPERQIGWSFAISLPLGVQQMASDSKLQSI